MVNYENGKIYRLKSKSINISYIGSTAMPYLSQRLAKHKQTYNRFLNEKFRFMTCFHILSCEDYEIELITNFPCANKQQLAKEEGKYIKIERETGIYTCLNKNIAGRTKQEYNAVTKERKQIYDKNYYSKNKDLISKHHKEKKECEKCLSIVQKSDLKKHQRTLKCQAIANLNNVCKDIEEIKI